MFNIFDVFNIYKNIIILNNTLRTVIYQCSINELILDNIKNCMKAIRC